MSAKIKVEMLIYFSILSILYFLQYRHTQGFYIDTDNYMHALRTIDFMQNPSFFEHKFMQTNYPFGEISHWTRLMDILMVICSFPFLFFENLKNAVFSGGFILVPLCALTTLYFLQKTGTKWLSAKTRFALYITLLVSAQFKMIYKINRPDHHAVIMALTACLLWLLCQYINSAHRKTIILSAVICGLSLWLAPEGVFLYFCTLIFLYLGYVFLKFSYQSLVDFSFIYSICCTFFWLINPPFQGYLYADNGRLSILFVILSAMIAGVIFMGKKISSKWRQFFFFSLCGTACLLSLYFGNFLSSPLDASIKIAFVNRISEMKSGATFYYLAYPLLGIASLAALFLNKQNYAKPLLLSCFLIPYTILSIVAMRFTAYAILFGIITIAVWLEQKHFKSIKFAILTLCLCLVEYISFTIDALYRYDLAKPLPIAQIADINYLKNYPFGEGAVVSDIFWAPQIIWFTDKPTVASPYHRNIEGIIDNHKILMSSNMFEVANLIKKHQVGTIVLPINMDNEYYVNPAENTDKLYGKMFSGKDYPTWLEEDKKTRAHNLIILKVIPENLPHE